MIRSRLFWKLYVGYMVLIALTTTGIGILVGRQAEHDLLEAMRASLIERTVLLREIASTQTGEALAESMRRLGGETKTRFEIFDAEGRRVASSVEVGPASVEGAEIGVRVRSTSAGARFMEAALPIGPANAREGLVRASADLSDLERRLEVLRGRIALGAVLAAFAALFLGLFVGHWYTAPLVSMSRVAESIAGGRFDERLEIRRRDEVGNLGRSFNAMADQLRGRIETITDDRNKLLAVLGSMVEGVVAVDDEERILHVNAVAGRILRIGLAECEGRPIWEVSRIRDLSEIVSQTLAASSEMSREMELREGAKEQVIEMYSAPIVGSGGELRGAVVVLHDVTELRRLELVRREFVANVSHELKTPLTVIRGFVETMIDDPSMNDVTRAGFLERIRLQSDRLSALVADLLTLSRVESGEGGEQHEPLDLVRIARGSSQALAPSAERKRIALHLAATARTAPVFGDEHHLRLMIDNLLDNAVKYTPEGGHVTIAVGADENTVFVEVRDTGIGIEPRHRERIFERFYRVDKGRSREMGGTGLGLSIVKHVVAAHGGQVTVESTPGKGTTFRVILPRGAEFLDASAPASSG